MLQIRLMISLMMPQREHIPHEPCDIPIVEMAY